MHLLLNVRFDAREKKPLYRIFSEAIREAISEGRLKPGDALPTIRNFAQQYSIGRSTALRCYEDLLSQGVVETRLRVGTCVSRLSTQSNLDFSPRRIDAPVPLSEFGARVLSGDARDISGASQWFTSFSPDLQIADQIKRSFSRLSDSFADESKTLNEMDSLGYRPLRSQMEDYLRRTRAVKASADRIVVSSISDIELLIRLLVEPGDVVALEDPDNTQIRRIFEINGASTKLIPVDSSGLCVSELQQLQSPVKLVYVTPSHQDPTGVTMTLQRRHELIEWACRNNAIIIEDDSNSEFSYTSLPLPAIQALDKSNLVIYLSSTWRLLEPLIRLSVAVLPERLIKTFARAKRITSSNSSLLDQMILSDLMQDGRLERHFFKTKCILAKRRQALIFNLALELGRLVSIAKTHSGTNIQVAFSKQLQDPLIISAAKDAGLLLIALSRTESESHSGQYLISFSHCDEPELIEHVKLFGNTCRNIVTPQASPLQASDDSAALKVNAELYLSNPAIDTIP